MSESEPLPIDDSVWEHIGHSDTTVCVRISDSWSLDLLGALSDINRQLRADHEKGLVLLTRLAAILSAAPMGLAETVAKEILVIEETEDLDSQILKVLKDG